MKKKVEKRIDYFFLDILNYNRINLRVKKKAEKEIKKYLNIIELKYKEYIYKINIKNITKSKITAYLLINMIKDKIEKTYKANIKVIINKVLKILEKLGDKRLIKGYRVRISGRFMQKMRRTRRLKFKKGIMSPSKVIGKIDFALVSVILKFGVCGIKLTINK
jgi:ribosomal protein S3